MPLLRCSMREEPLKVEGPNELSDGDTVVVEYVPTSAGVFGEKKTLITTVDESEPDGMLDGSRYGEVYLNEYRDEKDTIPRRRLKCQGGMWSIEYRQTRRDGPQWTRMNRPADCEVWFEDF